MMTVTKMDTWTAGAFQPPRPRRSRGVQSMSAQVVRQRNRICVQDWLQWFRNCPQKMKIAIGVDVRHGARCTPALRILSIKMSTKPSSMASKADSSCPPRRKPKGVVPGSLATGTWRGEEVW